MDGTQLPVIAAGPTWAVVAKPSGLAVHPSARVRDRITLIDLARRRFGAAVAAVHRLDRATSGCLLLSLAPTATPALQAALSAGTKRYVAFVRGNALQPVRCDAPLSDDDGGLQAASTTLTPIAGGDDPRCALVLAVPHTGRTHQIRRHLRDLSHPVLGDSSHGDTRVNRWWRERYGLDRLALHCLSLSLPAGPDHTAIDASCPLPDALGAVGRRLPWWPDAVRALPELAFTEATA